MPQELVRPHPWELPRETIELIPLTVTSGDLETTDYTVACVPTYARPASGDFTAPGSAGGDTGYLLNGPVLSASGIYDFHGFVKIDSNPEDPVIPVFTLKLT